MWRARYIVHLALETPCEGICSYCDAVTIVNKRMHQRSVEHNRVTLRFHRTAVYLTF